jgi:hypothetical protein
MVLAHPRTTFHPCTCGLRGGWSAMTILEVAARKPTRRRRSWSTASFTPTHDYVGSLLQLFFRYSARLVVTMIYDLFTCKFPLCNGRYNARVAYPLPYSSIRAVMRSFWSRSFVAWLWLDQSGLKRGGSWLCHVTEWLVRVLPLLYVQHVPTGWNHHRDELRARLVNWANKLRLCVAIF